MVILKKDLVKISLVKNLPSAATFTFLSRGRSSFDIWRQRLDVFIVMNSFLEDLTPEVRKIKEKLSQENFLVLNCGTCQY